MTSSLRTFAFYTPTFQPTVQTDNALSIGWSEWFDVTAAKPLYVGHQQPRLPRDFGFYDLRLIDTYRLQAATAQAYGINGFIVDHFWFNGTQMYNKLVEEMLEDFSIDQQFALAWNNDDLLTPDGEVIVAQTYSNEDDLNHIHALLPALNDLRCIRIEGKPLLVIKNVKGLPNPAALTALWREEAAVAGIGEIYLAYVDESNALVSPEQYGFDAAIEAAPQRTSATATFYETLETHNYLDMASALLAEPEADYRRFSCVTPGFDNSPGRGMNGCIMTDSSPDLFKGWLSATLQRDFERSNGGEVLLFVNSWNDWANGTQLEPCSVLGTSLLDALEAGIAQATPEEPSFRVVEDNAEATPVPQPSVVGPASGSAGLQDDNEQTRTGVSVVLVTSGDPEALMTTLQSALATCTDVGKLEFVVVDNGSTDGTQDVLSALQNEVLSVRNDTVLPAITAWSQGLNCATGEYVVFVTNDIVMQPNWLEPSILTLATDPETSTVTPAVNVNGSITNSQPLNMVTGVCLVSRRAALNGTLPSEARVVPQAVVTNVTQTAPASSPWALA